jgi:hypothetical protein
VVQSTLGLIACSIPDGLQIIISFAVTSVFTSATALVHAYIPGGQATRSGSRFQLLALTHLTLSRKAIISDKQSSRRWLHEFTSVLLEGLCDVQVMTGMAITATGLAQHNDILIYHLSMIYNLWLLTNNSLWAAQSPAFGSMRGYQGAISDCGWRIAPAWYQARLRGLCIVISVVLGSLVQYELIRRTRTWNQDESGQCYRPPVVLARGSQWYFFTVRCVYLIDVIVEELLEVLRVTGPKAQRFAATRGPCQTLLESVQRGNNHLDIVSMQDTLRNPTLTLADAKFWIRYLPKRIGLLLLSSMSWIMLQWLATCATGEGTPRLTVLLFCAYMIWAMQDIIAMKVLNRELIQGSESKWEFGQVLSMVLLVYLLFSIMDASEKATNSHRIRPKEEESHGSLQRDGIV